MNDPREAAIHCEMKKYALRQSKDGIIVSFVLHPHEVPKDLQTAEIGSRWMVALVEIGDDEEPAKEQPVPEPHSGRVGWEQVKIPSPSYIAEKQKMGWEKLQPASQCAIRLNDPVFMAFIRERYNFNGEDELKEWLQISSKTELSTDHRKRVLWHQLDSQFQAWKLTGE